MSKTESQMRAEMIAAQTTRECMNYLDPYRPSPPSTVKKEATSECLNDGPITEAALLEMGFEKSNNGWFSVAIEPIRLQYSSNSEILYIVELKDGAGYMKLPPITTIPQLRKLIDALKGV